MEKVIANMMARIEDLAIRHDRKQERCGILEMKLTNAEGAARLAENRTASIRTELEARYRKHVDPDALIPVRRQAHDALQDVDFAIAKSNASQAKTVKASLESAAKNLRCVVMGLKVLK